MRQPGWGPKVFSLRLSRAPIYSLGQLGFWQPFHMLKGFCLSERVGLHNPKDRI